MTWVVFLPVPIINGGLREKFYKPIVGPRVSEWIGLVVLGGAFMLVVFFMLRHQLPNFSMQDLFLTGLLWLVLTVVFEFSLGLALGQSRAQIMENYNVAAGHLWSFIVLIIFLTPYLLRSVLNKF